MASSLPPSRLCVLCVLCSSVLTAILLRPAESTPAGGPWLPLDLFVLWGPGTGQKGRVRSPFWRCPLAGVAGSAPVGCLSPVPPAGSVAASTGAPPGEGRTRMCAN